MSVIIHIMINRINENINWRTILYLFTKLYLKLSKQISNYEDKTRALLFDDSPLKKNGKRIKDTSKMHDHITGNFIVNDVKNRELHIFLKIELIPVFGILYGIK